MLIAGDNGDLFDPGHRATCQHVNRYDGTHVCTGQRVTQGMVSTGN